MVLILNFTAKQSVNSEPNILTLPLDSFSFSRELLERCVTFVYETLAG